MLQIAVVIDQDGNEAMYVGGKLADTEGNTVYAVDIAKAGNLEPIVLSHVSVQWSGPWPEMLPELIFKAT